MIKKLLKLTSLKLCKGKYLKHLYGFETLKHLRGFTQNLTSL